MESLNTLKTDVIENFGTPCAVIDLDVVERNIANAQSLCTNAGLANRPHIKTHKSPLLAQMQIDAGARGITCQKLGEAEVMANAGITDIIIATNLLGAARSGKLAGLQKRIPLKVCADNLVSLSHYAQAAVGSWPETQLFYDEIKTKLDVIGLKPAIVSTGGTPNFIHLGKLDGATEHRAGTCIFNDLMMIDAGVATLEDCAFQIYTSVVSRANPQRGILDAGSKTLTSDLGGLDGHGKIAEHPGARIHKLSEEHGFLDLSQCSAKPEVGDIVRVIPNHVCVSVNMFEQLVAVRAGKIEQIIPVAGRGKLV